MQKTIITAASLAALATVVAMNASADEVSDLGKLTVTATKKSTAVSDAPASVSVVTAEEIENKNVQRVDEAIKDLPSVYVRSLGGHRPSAWANTVTLRGIPGYQRTAVLVDGQPMNNAFSGGVNWSSIPVEDVESIEVVPGPFSSLYGGNAMGGVINIISKAPVQREVTVKGGYGSDDFASADIYYRDKVSDRLGISANVGYKESDGYVADYVTKTGVAGAGAIPVTGWQRTTDKYGDTVYLLGDQGPRSWWQQNVGAKLFYDLTDTSKVYFGISDHEHETDFEAYNTYLRDAAGNPIVSGNIGINDGGALNRTISEKDFLFGPNGETATRYSLGYETTFDAEVNFKVDAFYADNTYWYVSQLTGAKKDGGAGKLVDIPNSRSNFAVQVSLPLNDMHYLTAGASVGRDELDKREYSLANWTNRSAKGTLGYQGKGESQTYAVFVQDEIFVASNMRLYLGGRYDYWETEGEVHQYTAPGYDATYATRSKNAFSPKASVVYNPADRTVLRASVGRAFRAPGLSDMYSTWVTSSGKVNESNPDLEPEKTTSWEIGGEQGLWRGATVKATYYENYLTDLIYQTEVNASLTVKRNAGEAEIKGVELEFRQIVATGIEFFANVTFNDATITENSAAPETEGKNITYVPEEQFNLGVNGRRGPWRGSMAWRYVGDVYTNEENLDTTNDVYDSYDPYHVIDAKLGYSLTKQLSASIAVENLLDREYYQSAKAPGRTAFAEIAYQF